MAKTRRLIYDDIFSSVSLARIDPAGRYFYVGLIVIADDDGRLLANPKYLQSRIFPFDSKIGVLKIAKWLLQFHEIGKIVLYTANSEEYLMHPKWTDWQHIRQDMYTQSRYPELNMVQKRTKSVTYGTKAVHKVSKDKVIDTSTKSARFSMKEEIEKMEKEERRDINIIALFFREKQTDLQTREQLNIAIRRHLRVAGKLKSFTDKQIVGAIKNIKREMRDIDWTLDTVLKVLTK